MLRTFERAKLERSLSIHQKADLFAVLMSGPTNFQLNPLQRYITLNTAEKRRRLLYYIIITRSVRFEIDVKMAAKTICDKTFFLLCSINLIIIIDVSLLSAYVIKHLLFVMHIIYIFVPVGIPVECQLLTQLLCYFVSFIKD